MRSRRRYLSIWRNDSHLCEWSSGVEEFILEEINRKDEEWYGPTVVDGSVLLALPGEVVRNEE